MIRIESDFGDLDQFVEGLHSDNLILNFSQIFVNKYKFPIYIKNTGKIGIKLLPFDHY